MFNRRKKAGEISETDARVAANEPAQREQEWEEYVPSEKQFASQNRAEDVHVPQDNVQENTHDSPMIDGEDGLLDIASFPALRIAYGLDTPESVRVPVFEQEEELDEEERRQRLILKYAEEADEQPESEASVQAETLPALFRFEPTVERDETEVPQENESEEFTMESEIEKQREISGELFEYISAIESDARTLISQREQDRKKAGQPKAYDPYNANFNSRYDDTEQVLEETPEIPIKPKFQLEG